MTSPYLLQDLKADEGLRLDAYPDPITGGSPWTIGYGHTGTEVKKGLVWTQDQADAALIADVMRVKALLDTNLPAWRALSPLRQDVLVNMGFNMGVAGLMTFRNMIAAIQRRDWTAAKAAGLASRWATQVPARALRLMTQLETDARPGSDDVAASQSSAPDPGQSGAA